MRAPSHDTHRLRFSQPSHNMNGAAPNFVRDNEPRDEKEG